MQEAEELPLGERVLFHRQRLGLTQRELGARMGRTDEWVRKVESGRHRIDRVSVLRRLSTTLDVQLSHLLDGIPEVPD